MNFEGARFAARRGTRCVFRVQRVATFVIRHSLFDIRHFAWLGTRKARSEFILAGRTRLQTFHRSHHDGPQPPRRMRTLPLPSPPPGYPLGVGEGRVGGDFHSRAQRPQRVTKLHHIQNIWPCRIFRMPLGFSLPGPRNIGGFSAWLCILCGSSAMSGFSRNHREG